MHSKSERGHAINIANAQLLLTHITELGALYNPSNQKLSLANLQAIFDQAVAHHHLVNTLVAPYSMAVDHREQVFAPLNKSITLLRKAYKATDGVTAAHVDDFMTIARKLKGMRKEAIKPDTNSDEQQVHHSTSQMGYDQRTNNMDLLIALLENTPNYTPNEVAYQINTIKALKDQMLQATQSVANTYIPLNTARSNRNHSMYLSDDNLVDLFNKAKDYMGTILDPKSALCKAIVKIKFAKIK